MTRGRVVVAGLAGGVAMFLWSSLAHMALPLGGAGITEITSNETALLDSMHQSLGNASGLYMFPSLGFASGASRSDAMKNYDAKLVTNPSGLLIYHPPGAKSLTPGLLVTNSLLSCWKPCSPFGFWRKPRLPVLRDESVLWQRPVS